MYRVKGAKMEEGGGGCDWDGGGLEVVERVRKMSSCVKD